MGAAMGLGFIFGPGIGGLLARFGHDTPFLRRPARSACSTAPWPRSPCARATRRHGGRDKRQGWRRHGAPCESPLLPFYWVAFCVTFAMAALETTFPLFIQDRFGYGAFEMGWMFLFMGTAVALVQGVMLGRTHPASWRGAGAAHSA